MTLCARAIAGALLVTAMGCGPRRHAAALQPELETPDQTPADTPTSASEHGDDHGVPLEEVDVSVALGADGATAVIEAPHHAAVRASVDEVEIVGGPDYHVLVGRGTVDPLGEKARIVRRFGDEFRRFLRDEGSLIIYETGTPQEQRYHFFMTAVTSDSIPYHCRTPASGLVRKQAVEHMIEVCQNVRLVRRSHDAGQK